MRRFPLFAAFALALAAASLSTGAFAQRAGDPKRGVPYGPRDDVRAFAAEVSSETGLDRRSVERWLAAARFQPQIVTLMSKPIVEPPKWYDYRGPFLSAERVAGGVAWWRTNEDALARAEAKWGVPPEIVVAIVGIETHYGRLTGSFRVIDALATLAFDYPRRALMPESTLDAGVLAERLQGLAGDRASLVAMAEAARAQARVDAAETVAKGCLEVAR